MAITSIPDDDAIKWGHKGDTTSYDLLAALSSFISSGQDPKDLDGHLEAIRPKAGWQEEWHAQYRMAIERKMVNAPIVRYSREYGFWCKRNPPTKPG